METSDCGERRRQSGIGGETHMTYKRGVSKGRPDISILVELIVLSKLCKRKKNVNF